MVFNSLLFFFTVVPILGIHFALHRRYPRADKIAILLYSLFFYGMWNPWFLFLILFSTYVDYRVALLMEQYPSKKRLLLAVSVITNIGLLSFFKYYNFFVSTVGLAAKWTGASLNAPILHVVLPLGLSFYTFEALSYTIDVYRGVLKPQQSLLNVALFIAFFPHLIAGPIVRAKDLIVQFERPARVSYPALADGILLIVVGLFMKCVIADNAAARVNPLFANWQTNSLADNWDAAMMFGVQVYGDFAGYSAIAIGLARMMGYRIRANFLSPYGAVGFADFWTRWHISLSSWLRDYVYFSIGGLRRRRWNLYRNLLITMLIAGLWHGASFLFILWGALHGIYLCIERWITSSIRVPNHWARRFAPLGIVATFLLVSITWLLFRASTFSQCGAMMRGLFTGSIRPHNGERLDFIIISMVLIVESVGARVNLLRIVAAIPVLRAALIIFALLAVYFFSGSGRQFIYFQF